MHDRNIGFETTVAVLRSKLEILLFGQKITFFRFYGLLENVDEAVFLKAPNDNVYIPAFVEELVLEAFAHTADYGQLEVPLGSQVPVVSDSAVDSVFCCFANRAGVENNQICFGAVGSWAPSRVYKLPFQCLGFRLIHLAAVGFDKISAISGSHGAPASLCAG